MMPHVSNRKGPEVISKSDWVTYTVETTDNNDKTFVTAYASDTMRDELAIYNAAPVWKKQAADAAAQQAAQEKAGAARQQAANTPDTATPCDQASILDQKKLSNVVTVAPGICVAYLAEISSYGNHFSKLDYKMTLDGAKVTGDPTQWQSELYSDQALTADQQAALDRVNYWAEKNKPHVEPRRVRQQIKCPPGADATAKCYGGF
jgi:hypothetical protein